MNIGQKAHTVVGFDRGFVPWLLEITTPNCRFSARREGVTTNGRIKYWHDGKHPALTLVDKGGNEAYVRIAKMTTISPKFPVPTSETADDAIQFHKELTKAIRA